ncbi:hypothetical protein [Pseudoalteromonas sp. MMG024]|uniref:hypothetical protein n=1 Tax=Pseudoalteromonas sp. MMG024 TaxID=2909980 RepID=UPI001F2FE67F|nr:hypothetical protein [Pseudoalteromonas sp. MMG024]MCF6458486.1 hypothetical protein [Pseudoalteromonas sp. MMG024]
MRLFFIILSVFLIVGCSEDRVNEKQLRNQNIDKLWGETVTPYLQDDLWLELYTYDAGQILMVPLHLAFKTSDEEKIQEFHDFFSRYSLVMTESVNENRLKQLQFWYLTSQYLTFVSQRDEWQQYHSEISNFISEYLTDLWFYRPVHVFGIHTNGLKERVIWKLNNKDYLPKYKRATFDEEFFTFVIAADLSTLRIDQSETHTQTQKDILDLALLVFESEVVYTSDGWLYQPGQWQDYDDYLYAGHDVLTDTMEPKPVEGIALDSSHAHRFSLWFDSLINSSEYNSPRYLYYSDLKTGFIKQFINKIIVPISNDFPGIRMKNYTDGHNGVYRYRFHDGSDSAIKLGYEAYNLSGTLFSGFYPLMNDELVNNEYASACNLFPLAEEVILLYMGLGPARASHDLVSMPNFFTNGFAELICLSSIKIKQY